jgi:hypothetical protein
VSSSKIKKAWLGTIYTAREPLPENDTHAETENYSGVGERTKKKTV